MIISKLKRLILPSVIFSALYFALFYEYKGFLDLFYNLINGCGHMWFLPMLFWCFVGGWFLIRIPINDTWKMLLLALVNISTIYILPFQLSHVAMFLFYFYGGYVVYRNRYRIIVALTPQRIIIGWFLFLIVFAVFRPLQGMIVYTHEASKLYKLAVLVGKNTCQLVYASLGVMVFYCTAVYYIQCHHLKQFTFKLSACCFGVYLFQQFVLQFLYYKTSFPSMVGPYWLPWLGFVIAVIVSHILSILLLKTKAGKHLIG